MMSWMMVWVIALKPFVECVFCRRFVILDDCVMFSTDLISFSIIFGSIVNAVFNKDNSVGHSFTENLTFASAFRFLLEETGKT